MAEFCLDCWNKINQVQDSKGRYVLSWERELCEEYGQYKRVIIVERLWSRTQKRLLEVIQDLRRS